MLNYTLADANNILYKRVDKRTARRCYEAGKPVVLCPHKMYPFGEWQQGCEIGRQKDTSISFDYYCQNMIWYNCNNETGLYLSYYVEV